MNASPNQPVELLYRPSAMLRMRPRTRGNYKQQHDIVYAEAHGVGLIMDVFSPEGSASGAAVVMVVSGGWYADRVLLNEYVGLGLMDILCDHGFTVFAVSPGSVSLFTGLDMIRHIHAAVRHIRVHGRNYGIDPERLALAGVSAGGHLAAITALVPSPGRPAARDPLRQCSTRVNAVAVFCPPTDLLDYQGQRFDAFPLEGLDVGRLLFAEGLSGKTDAEIEERLRILSPARIAPTHLPPFMIVQGKADPIVPWEQADKLAASILRAGGQAQIVYNDAGGHLWEPMTPEIELTAAWLETQLLHTRPTAQ